MYWTKLHQSALSFSKEKRKQVQMGILISMIAIIVVFAKFWQDDSKYIFLLLSSIPSIFSLIFPAVLQPILYVWMVLGQLLGDFMSTILISIIYLFLITPISIFIKKKKPEGWIKKKSSNIDLEKMY